MPSLQKTGKRRLIFHGIKMYLFFTVMFALWGESKSDPFNGRLTPVKSVSGSQLDDYSSLNDCDVPEENLTDLCKQEFLSCRDNCDNFVSFPVTLFSTYENCYCDELCLSYGDCCWDYAVECHSSIKTIQDNVDSDVIQKWWTPASKSVCLESSIRTISHCPDSWKSHMVRPFDDAVKYPYQVVNDMPVYDKQSMRHFLNVSYFICHGCDLENAEFWAARYRIPEHQTVTQVRDIVTGAISFDASLVTFHPQNLSWTRYCEANGFDLNYQCDVCDQRDSPVLKYENVSDICSKAYGKREDNQPDFAPTCVGNVVQRSMPLEKYLNLTVRTFLDREVQRVVITQDVHPVSGWQVMECTLGQQTACSVLDSSCHRKFTRYKGKCYEIIYFVLKTTYSREDAKVVNGNLKFVVKLLEKAIPGIRIKYKGTEISQIFLMTSETSDYRVDSTRVHEDTPVEERIVQTLVSLKGVPRMAAVVFDFKFVLASSESLKIRNIDLSFLQRVEKSETSESVPGILRKELTRTVEAVRLFASRNGSDVLCMFVVCFFSLLVI